MGFSGILKLMPSIISVSFYFLFFLFFFSQTCSAKVSFKKFSSYTSTDWVIIYNQSEKHEDLSGYTIHDEKSEIAEINCLLTSDGYLAVSCSNRLNKAGDVISLRNSQGDIIDCFSYGSDKVCPGQESYDLESLKEGEYGVKNDIWEITENPEGEDYNDCLTPTPTPTLTPTPSPTNTPTEKPQKGICNVKEVSSDEGGELSHVKVYLDDEYTHHYAPEELDCLPGKHTIKLEKNGYLAWEQEVEISAGQEIVIQAQMNKAVSPTATSLPTPTLTPTTKPSSTLTPTKSISPTKSPSNLSSTPFLTNDFSNPEEEEDDLGEVLGESTPPKKNNKNKFIALGLITIGGGFISTVGAWPYLKKFFATIKKDED